MVNLFWVFSGKDVHHGIGTGVAAHQRRDAGAAAAAAQSGAAELRAVQPLPRPVNFFLIKKKFWQFFHFGPSLNRSISVC